MYFSARYMQVLLTSFFWMTLYSVSCPTEVSKSSKRLNHYSLSVFCYLHTQILRLRYGTLCTPCTGNLWEGGTAVWTLLQFGSKPLFIWSGQKRLQNRTKASASKFPVNRQLANLRGLLSESSSWTCSSPGSTDTAAESWRGKRVKEPSLSPYANIKELRAQERYVRSAAGMSESCLFCVCRQSTVYLNIYMISC